MSNEELAPTTSADTSVTFVVRSGNSITVSTSGISGVEEVTLEIKKGNNYSPSGIVIKAESWEITAPGMYRLNKPITASPVGLYVNHPGFARGS